MTNRDFNTPKFDELLDFIGNKVNEGSIDIKIVPDFKDKLHTAIEELYDVSRELVKKTNNKVGWYAFSIGVVIGISIEIIIYLILSF